MPIETLSERMKIDIALKESEHRYKRSDKIYSRLLLLTICILLTVFREMDLLLFPRFWAEEGQLFYPFALHHSVYEILITPQVGYLTLFNSFVSLMQAKMVSAEFAPIISTYCGFIVQLIPIVIITFTDHVFWNTLHKKLIISIAIIIVMPPELWLNTTNSHFIFGLGTFLVILISAEGLSRLKKTLLRLLLFIGGLTGPASMFLAPVFLYKAYREKEKEKYIQAAIICACSLLQLSVLIYTLLYSNSYQRLKQFDWHLTINAFLIDNFSLNTNREIVGITMIPIYIYLLLANRKNVERFILLISFMIVAVFSTLGSLQMQGAPRYSYLPTCMLIILISSEAFELKKEEIKFKPVLMALIFSGSLILSAISYKYRMQYVYTADLPKWKDEMAKYRSDTLYKPKIHPDYLYVQF